MLQLMILKKYNFILLLFSVFFISKSSYSEQLKSNEAIWSNQVVDQIGVNIHLSFYNSPYKKFDEVVVPALSDLGVEYLRDVFPKNNSFNKLYISRLKRLCGSGYKFSLVVFDETNPNYAIDYSDAKDLIEALQGCVGILEGVNEPNLKPIKNWAEITTNSQKKLFQYVSVTNFNVAKPLVAGPSLWGESAQIIGDISPIVDLGNWHTYSGGRNPESGVDKDGSIYFYLEQAGRIYKKKKILVSEDGYHSAMDVPFNKHRPTPNDVIATYIPRLILLHQELGVYRTFIYELIDTKNNGMGDPESNFGLLDYNGKKKPQFYAVKSLIKNFKDISEVDCGSGRQFFVDFISARDTKVQMFCKSNNKWIIALWQPIEIWDPELRKRITQNSGAVKLTFPDSIGKLIKVVEIDKSGAEIVTEHYVNRFGELTVNAKDTVSLIEFSMP